MVMHNPHQPMSNQVFHPIPMNENTKMPHFQPCFPVWYSNERKQPRNWCNESDVKGKRPRSVPNEEVCGEKTAAKKIEISKNDKENITTLTKKTTGSIRRTKKKKTVRVVENEDYNTIIPLNEEELYSLIDQFVVNPDELFSNGYPHLIAENQVRIMKYAFGTALYPTPRRDSQSNEDNKPEKEGYEATAIEERVERVCVRCNEIFYVSDEDYITTDHCSYHWGRIFQCRYTCCNLYTGSDGCTTSKFHVWNGTVPGVNENLEGFVKTRKSKVRRRKVFALDCEMSYTVKGLELTRVAVLGFDGSIVYDHFVKPENEVVDYNTRFSGVTESDVNGPDAKKFLEVQKDILSLVAEDTILIGHALENDLLALKLLHLKIVDTSLIFPHQRGRPFKYSLKHLMSTLLRKPIQVVPTGHCPYEDALSCLELIYYKLKSLHGDLFFDFILQNDKV